jgi:hypothetical protein
MTSERIVEIEIVKLTGANVHPDDETLLGKAYGVTIYRWSSESDLTWFVTSIRHGSLHTDDNGKRTATFTATPNELKVIKNAGSYRG